MNLLDTHRALNVIGATLCCRQSRPGSAHSTMLATTTTRPSPRPVLFEDPPPTSPSSWSCPAPPLRPHQPSSPKAIHSGLGSILIKTAGNGTQVWPQGVYSPISVRFPYHWRCYSCLPIGLPCPDCIPSSLHYPHFFPRQCHTRPYRLLPTRATTLPRYYRAITLPRYTTRFLYAFSSCPTVYHATRNDPGAHALLPYYQPLTTHHHARTTR